MAVQSLEASAAADAQTSCLNRVRVASDGRGAVTPISEIPLRPMHRDATHTALSQAL